jgi:hypothetical protein
LPLIVELPDLIDATDFLTLPIDPPPNLSPVTCRRYYAQGKQAGFGQQFKKFQDLESARLGDLGCYRRGLAWTSDSARQGVEFNCEIQPHA